MGFGEEWFNLRDLI